MKSRFTKSVVTTLAASFLAISFSLSAPYEKGQQVEPFTTKDQYEQAFTFKPAETHYLLVSHDMETGKKANAALTALGKDYLGSKKAIYMANIFGMPGVGRMFAIPKMKKYNHRIILADDAALIARFPAQAGKVTVLELSGGKVQSVTYWTPGAEGVEARLK
ncbi:MAG: FAD/FMN-containing dehydrogenase [Verrucomicrobiota bacterium]